MGPPGPSRSLLLAIVAAAAVAVYLNSLPNGFALDDPVVVAENPLVRSFSNCQACHRNAEIGVYGEHDIVIAGYGRWDD